MIILASGLAPTVGRRRKWIFLNMLFQLIISVTPLLHEGLIDQVFIDHDMEHGQSKPGKEGEQAVIDAYRACDQF